MSVHLRIWIFGQGGLEISQEHGLGEPSMMTFIHEHLNSILEPFMDHAPGLSGTSPPRHGPKSCMSSHFLAHLACQVGSEVNQLHGRLALAFSRDL